MKLGPAFVVRLQAVLVAIGCFALPLFPSRLVPVILALALWPAIAVQRARLWPRAVPFLAVSAGWLAAWWWCFDRRQLVDFLDLALVGPVLAAGAIAWPSRHLQRYLAWGGMACAAAAIAQTILGQTAPLHWMSSEWSWGRAVGTLRNPNVLGAYLAAAMPMVLAGNRARASRLLALAWLALASLAAASRGGWLAAPIGLAVFLWCRRSPMLPAFLVLTLAAVFFPWPPGGRMLVVLSGADPTVNARLQIWRHCLALWWAKPVAGWGGAAPLIGTHPHNMCLEIAVRGGLLAIAGFVPLVLLGCRQLWWAPKRAAAAAAGSLSALLVFGLGDVVLSHPALASFFWLSCGMLAKEGLERATT